MTRCFPVCFNFAFNFNLRRYIKAAKANAPCIIFIDEIDAVGGKRNPKVGRCRSTPGGPQVDPRLTPG
jgi:hypothetical protein